MTKNSNYLFVIVDVVVVVVFFVFVILIHIITRQEVSTLLRFLKMVTKEQNLESIIVLIKKIAP